MDVKGGSALLRTVQQTLAANERSEARLDQLFGFDPTKSIAGYVRFQTPPDSMGVFGYLESKTAGGGLTAVAAQASGYSDVSFSQIANGADSYTGLTLMNAGLQASSITIDAFDSQGYPSDPATLTLAPNTGWSGLLSELLPGTQGQTGGRVHLGDSNLGIDVYWSFGRGACRGQRVGSTTERPACFLSYRWHCDQRGQFRFACDSARSLGSRHLRPDNAVESGRFSTAVTQ
jgi:hypothetical protein